MSSKIAWFCFILLIICLPLGKAQASADLRKVAYGQEGADQTLNILYPPGPGPFPMVAFIHGGGWLHGNGALGDTIAKSLTPLGIAVVSIDYRKPPAVAVQDMVLDIAKALAFVRKNSGQFNLRSDNFAIVGHSAGGHMAALIGTDFSYARKAGLDTSQMAVVGTLDGIFDFTTLQGELNDTRAAREQQRQALGDDPAVWDALSPTLVVRRGGTFPETFCVIHEERKQLFVTQADGFESALQAAHARVFDTNLPTYGHMDLVNDFAHPGGPASSAFLGCLKAAGMIR